MNSYIILLLGMALVTYLPRMLPLVILSEIELPPFWKRFMLYIPSAALSALIFPGILQATDSVFAALAGGLIAVLLAYFKFSLLAVVTASIITALLFQLLF